MSKVMVVEDDVALREIYSIRITSEGYNVVTAGDGEEALAVAVRERPDLILADVMMPKISGFDMLDILRNTPETADIRIIMMTALSGEDQRERGERLGCDRYLVKSQVGIEDVVNTIHEVLGDRPAATPQPVPSQPMPSPQSAPLQPMSSQPAQPASVQPSIMPGQAPQPGQIPTPVAAQPNQAVPQPAPVSAVSSDDTVVVDAAPQESAFSLPPQPQPFQPQESQGINDNGQPAPYPAQ